MKKKGFTLIELLAVIVILAIIALIATPTILGVIEKAKKGAAQSSALGYIDAVEKQIAINVLDNSKTNIVDAVYETDDLNSDTYGVNVKGNKPETTSWVKIEKNQVVDYSFKIGNYIVSYNSDTKTADAVKGDTVKTKPDVEVSYKCIRATTLHTEECEQEDSTKYCSGAGYTTSGSKGTTTITYGNETVTERVLTSGDAFTCDVNGDDYFDEATERFYYVSELSSNTKYAVLVYYNNTKLGSADNTSASKIAYDSSNVNIQGPVTGIANLPTTTQWSNVRLSSISRAITTETGTTSTTGGELPTAFSYEGYAARLLTAQEVSSACGITVESSTTGELDGCNYLMENTTYTSSSMGTAGYWLETPLASSSLATAWSVYGHYRYVNFNYANNAGTGGVRPAIEVLKSDISY